MHENLIKTSQHEEQWEMQQQNPSLFYRNRCQYNSWEWPSKIIMLILANKLKHNTLQPVNPEWIHQGKRWVLAHHWITRGFPSWGYCWSREPGSQTSTQERKLNSKMSLNDLILLSYRSHGLISMPLEASYFIILLLFWKLLHWLYQVTFYFYFISLKSLLALFLQLIIFP